MGAPEPKDNEKDSSDKFFQIRAKCGSSQFFVFFFGVGEHDYQVDSSNLKYPVYQARLTTLYGCRNTLTKPSGEGRYLFTLIQVNLLYMIVFPRESS